MRLLPGTCIEPLPLDETAALASDKNGFPYALGGATSDVDVSLFDGGDYLAQI